jgi:hypothetical protein
MRFRTFFLGIWACCAWAALAAQPAGAYAPGEANLYAETKQLNQFFRRFNGEELPDGTRIYAGDARFQERSLRDAYLMQLMDQQNPELTPSLRRTFADQVLNAGCVLDFHGGNWFAEVEAEFLIGGRPETVLLFMELQPEAVGSKWVIASLYAACYEHALDPAPGAPQPDPAFLHPLSHELDFMNLSKAFRTPGNLGGFVSRSFQPDHLTLFLADAQDKKTVFRSVTQVKFHFFQVEGWYFEVTEFNRPGPNRGWLISQLFPLAPGQSGALLNAIYRR